MQTTTWEEVIRLTDGIHYDIDILQDLSSANIKGQLISDMSIDAIVDFITTQTEPTAPLPTHASDPATAAQFSKNLFKYADKQFEKDQRRAEKWKSGRRARKHESKKLFESIENGEFFKDMWGEV